MYKDKYMKLFDLINEETSGHKRLVLSIISMANKMYGKKPSKFEVEHYLKHLEGDTGFYDRIMARSKKIGGKGAENYYWGSIRRRCASHFAPDAIKKHR
jgi:hypothetical protein